MLVILLFGALLLAMLMKGTSSYAGMRHALVVLPSLAVAGAAALSMSWQRRSRALLGGIAVATLLALTSAVPVLRPWEYYNELVGGKDNAWRHLTDEGMDSGQRAKELAAYYHQVMEPKGEIPYIEYYESYAEDARRRVPSMQAQWKAYPESDTSDVVTGTVIVSTGYLQDRPLSELTLDYSPLLATSPVQRFGNLLIFRGTFVLPSPRANRLFYRALDAEYSETPDIARAELFLKRSLEAKPKVYYGWIELGNVLIQRGNREEALRAYQNAKLYAPEGDEIIGPLSRQIQRVSQEDLRNLPALRNPNLE